MFAWMLRRLLGSFGATGVAVETEAVNRVVFRLAVCRRKEF